MKKLVAATTAIYTEVDFRQQRIAIDSLSLPAAA